MKQSDDLLTNWNRAQQKLWESLAAALSNSRNENNKELIKAAHRGGLAAWEAAVNQSLKAQEVWLEQWFRQASISNPDIATASEQLQNIMSSWVSTQSQMWQNWFSLLRNYSNTDQQDAIQVQALTQSLSAPLPMPPSPAKPPQEASVTSINDRLASKEQSRTPTPAETQPASPPVAEDKATNVDDLKTIKGIGPALEKKLNELGIYSYQQIALVDPKDVERIESVLRFPGRLQRDNWVSQAREAHQRKYGSDPA